MVFFACNSCGASLKKNAVDKHAFQCRGSTVSCMDCQKDFSIKESADHIKCISEEEKYAGTGWKAPANFNKGEKKQQAWVDTVSDALKNGGGTLSPACKSLLQAISKHDNVPRKKPKFLNFVKNVSRNKFDERTIDTVFNLIDAQWKAQAEANKAAAAPPTTNGKNKDAGKENTAEADEDSRDAQKDEAPQENGVAKLSKRDKKEARREKQNKKEKKHKNSVSEEDNAAEKEQQQEVTNGHKESKKEKKKRKRVESASELEKKKTKSENGDEEEDEPQDTAGDEGEAEEEGVAPGEFKWGSIIKQILEKQSDHEISMKKLTKKVLSEYHAVVGDSKGNKTKEELISKLNKKLKKQQFKVFRDTVRLVE